ncbi:hypothetical protein [Qipengyuania marisflavi]|uniref:Uncharacterized protein n=1 Tax=Qipengyuania marisflavi TaxID=2486356 RepID=A0A5S3NYV2_9SPHN|nr:hypothetical protein [Qipengyuania marisflavi]TMM45343.1 hypothetical protein FEV51_12775 [Qipengyuania marisflavi]
MKIYRAGSLFVLLAVLLCVTIVAPEPLAGNKFLDGFVSHEIMAFLIVILTITFASVANIHLSVSRLQGSIRSAKARVELDKSFATPLRSETRSSAYLLFWAFCLCAVALLVKGQFPENDYVKSSVHSIAIVVVVTNAIVLYDIYKTVFALVAQPEISDGETQDYSDESPPAG